MTETSVSVSKSAPSDLPEVEEEGPFERRPHWSVRLLVHMLKVALMMGLAFALAAFAVLLYLSDFKNEQKAPATHAVVAEQVSDAPQESGAQPPAPDDKTASRILTWMFGN